MFLLDAPYVSDFLKQTIQDLKQPVLDTLGARSLAGDAELEFVDEIEFAARMAMGQRVYANSENALASLMDCGCNEDLSRQIDICKDKARFRETIAGVHPEYKFYRASIEDLADLDLSDMECPFIAKPARGFFSLGVHVVNDHSEWPEIVKTIHAEREAMNREYPESVVNAGEFIIEAGIPGEEYAIDVYYDDNGEPVITNILHHHFMDADDVSDRLYYTSVKIITDWLEPFTEYTAKVGKACDFRNFPMHLEVRVDEAGNINSIEANPLRFAGWCVADVTYFAWGFNPYEMYLGNKRPDWPGLIAGREGEVCAMVIGDVPPSIDRDSVTAIDQEGFCAQFDEVLEHRVIDHTKYPVFAFVFTRMDEAALSKLKKTLTGDFSRFIST